MFKIATKREKEKLFRTVKYYLKQPFIMEKMEIKIM